MTYEIENFTQANAKRLKDALKRIVAIDRQTGVPTATLKADENLLMKVMNIKKSENALIQFEAEKDFFESDVTAEDPTEEKEVAND